MHEHGLIKDLIRKLEKVAADHNSEKIVCARVWLGALSHMNPEHFMEHFQEHAVNNSIVKDMLLEFEVSDDPFNPHALEVRLLDIDVEKL